MSWKFALSPNFPHFRYVWWWIGPCSYCSIAMDRVIIFKGLTWGRGFTSSYDLNHQRLIDSVVALLCRPSWNSDFNDNISYPGGVTLSQAVRALQAYETWDTSPQMTNRLHFGPLLYPMLKILLFTQLLTLYSIVCNLVHHIISLTNSLTHYIGFWGLCLSSKYIPAGRLLRS